MRLHSRSVNAITMTIQTPNKLIPYHPPDFARPLRNVPSHRLNIANLPSPLHRIPMSSDLKKDSVLKPFQDLNIDFLIKRDDMSAGVELGGNKIRKLEFLLADALQSNCDTVVTIGGEQSNHCRATAAACRLVGLEPHLILRTKTANRVEEDKMVKQKDSFGHVGNLLFDRIVGSRIYTCTPGEYGRFGSKALVDRVCADLSGSKGKKVYPIPVGGSNGLGTWGYIEAIHELKDQLNGEKVHHVVFACGSGGTASGITLGLALGYKEEREKMPEIHAVGVCDDPEYFYQEVKRISQEMDLDLSGVSTCESIEGYIKECMTVHQGKGKGYASSTKEELSFIVNFALETGIILDPVYSGKALFYFMEELKDHPEKYRNTSILFWHTGGSLGVYDKIDEMSDMMSNISSVERLNAYSSSGKT